MQKTVVTRKSNNRFKYQRWDSNPHVLANTGFWIYSVRCSI